MKFARLHHTYGKPIKDYPHCRCTSCGHLFVFPKPTQGELDSFYMGVKYYDQAEVEESRLVSEAEQCIKRLKNLHLHFAWKNMRWMSAAKADTLSRRPFNMAEKLLA